MTDLPMCKFVKNPSALGAESTQVEFLSRITFFFIAIIGAGRIRFIQRLNRKIRIRVI